MSTTAWKDMRNQEIPRTKVSGIVRYRRGTLAGVKSLGERDRYPLIKSTGAGCRIRLELIFTTRNEMKQRPQKFLEEQIELANKVYWDTGENGMMEKLYLTYCRELAEYDPDHALLKGVYSPNVTSGKKVKHGSPMLSLEKVYDLESLKKWMAKVSRTPEEKFFVMPKYDGIAGRLYPDGTLATRGDGEEGENITHRKGILKYLCNSHQSEDAQTLQYDGEILCTFSDFIEHFESGKVTRKSGEKYKNPRNAVAGIMNSTEKVVGKVLTFVDHNYNAVECQMHTVDFAVRALKENTENDFPTDGVVVRLADGEYAATLGHTSHHWKHSIALKHDNESTWTQLEGVEFTMAKESIGMVGLLHPVELGGVTIKRVSLHNLDIIKSLDLCIGDIVHIERSGDVIPHIIESRIKKDTKREPISLDKCPSCGVRVIQDVQFYRCPNALCHDKVVNKIDSALKDLGSKGIAAATISDLVSWGKVQNIADMFDHKKVQEATFEGYEGYGKRKIEKIMNELRRLENTPMAGDQILATLNIPGFGRSIFKKLLKSVESVDELILMDVSDYNMLPNMAQTRSEILDNGLNGNIDILNELKSIFTLKTNKRKGEEMGTKGVCFTGKGDKGRAEYAEMAENAGWIVASSVTAGLDYLVCADPESNSGKMKKARANGTEVISYSAFEKMVA